MEGSCPSSAQLFFVSASRNASPHQWTSFQLLGDKTNSELLRKPFFKVGRKSLYRVERWCHYHIWEIVVTFCITTWQTCSFTRTWGEKCCILRSLISSYNRQLWTSWKLFQSMFMPTLSSGSISIPRMQRYQNCVNLVFLLSSHVLHTLTFFIAVFRII